MLSKMIRRQRLTGIVSLLKPAHRTKTPTTSRFSTRRLTIKAGSDISGLNSQVTAILGAQWGDEGKGKLVDVLSTKYEICARFNGGSNAGHTLVVDGQKFAMHLLPCGILNPHVVNVIGNGVVVHVPTLMTELQDLANSGIKFEGRLKISQRAHIVFDFHQTIDGMIEERADKIKEKNKDADGGIGTTRRGVGPTYASKMYRNGVRFGELKNWEKFKDRYLRLVDINKMKFNFEYNEQEELKRFEHYRDFLLPMIDDTIYFINEEYKQGKRILLEGANAALLDIDFGTYPMVTASNTTHGAISTGLGLAAPLIDTRIGVVKAYTTRVGYGPFPTELKNDIGKHLTAVGHEYGTTTGRERRCGWLDIPGLQYSNLLNAYTSLNLTKLDVLNGLDEIAIGTRYKLNGNPLPAGIMPPTIEELGQIEVEYETMPGWKEDITKCETYDDLPENAKHYLQRIEELCGIPVSWVGIGPGRLEMVGKGFTF